MSNEEAFHSLGKSARALFTPAQLAAFETAFDRQALYCRSKNYSEEGIPMFLMLEDASPSISATQGATPTLLSSRPTLSPDALFDLLLVTASEVYRQQLEARGELLNSEDISLMLEVLAEHFFIAAQPPRPSGQA